MFFSKLMNKCNSKRLVLAICISLCSSSIYAESSVLSPGDAAVTGFSGIVNPTNTSLFDLKGPSFRVISLPGTGTFGYRNTLKPFTVTAENIGQVFGIAMDNASQPNIYLAATAAYGLAIYKPNGGRLKRGAPGAQFMPGQFGPADLGGGPGSVWRIDGVSGKITLFANITYNGIENMPASLGGIAFDSVSQQLFVADRATGMIHCFAMDGTNKGVFDHGVQGLTMIGQPAVAFDPSTLASISHEKFDVENPSTWGFAPPARRVYALAVYGERLYYSVYGPQIWSVGIAANGSFVDDVRLEVDSPAAQSDIEISSIAFDTLGYMYIAERAAPSGDYNFIDVAHGGQTRVKRFAPKMPTEASPTFWVSPGDEYAIGMTPEYQNADGGVTLTCGRTLWATGERLLDSGAATDMHIDGLQGNDKDLLKPANVPPQQSWFVNYYDQQSDPSSRGHMGALINRSVCTGYSVPATPSGFSCSKGTCLVDGSCYVPPVCPGGTIFQDGYCVYPNCPWGFVRINGECIFPPIICDYGTVFIDGVCVPVPCPPELEWAPYGYCHCPDYAYYYDGHCLPPPPCPPDQTYYDGRCIPDNPCPPYTTYQDGYCYPQYPCPPDQIYQNGLCTPPTDCPPDQMYRDGTCTPTTPCPPGQTYQDGSCSACPPGQIISRGHCCPAGERFWHGHCRPDTQTTPPCPDGQVYRDGHCIRIIVDPIPGSPQNGGSNTPSTMTAPVTPPVVTPPRHPVTPPYPPVATPPRHPVTPPYPPVATPPRHPQVTPPHYPQVTPPRHPQVTPPRHPQVTPPRHPQVTPPHHPQVTPPHHPQVTPPRHPHVTPPRHPHVTPPRHPHVTPPRHPHVTPPRHPHVTPPRRPQVTPPRRPVVTPPYRRPQQHNHYQTSLNQAKIGGSVATQEEAQSSR